MGDTEMAKIPRPPRWSDIKPTKRFRLTRDERQELVRLAVPHAPAKDAMLQHVEILLGDHPFADYMFDTFKPTHARAMLQALIGKAQRLEKELYEIDWRTAADLTEAGSDVRKLPHHLEELRIHSEQLMAAYEGEPSPRKSTLTARDNVTIPGLAQIFDRFTTLDPNSDGQDITTQESQDRQCEFVEYALKAANIPCPSPGDASRGEQYQGRLRQIIKRLHIKPRPGR